MNPRDFETCRDRQTGRDHATGTAAVPVLRNPDIRPDRNLDTVVPAAAESPAARITIRPASRLAIFSTSRRSRSGAATTAIPDAGRRGRITGRHRRARTRDQVAIRAPQLNADLRYAYNENTAQQALSHPTAEAKVNGRFDVSITRLIGEGRYLDDALVTAGFNQQPRATTLGATAGLAQQFGSAEIAVKGSYDRILFSNAVLGNNQILNTQDRNYRQPGAQLRVSYAVSPELSPFIDLSLDRREHDMTTDFNGTRRDSKGIAGRGGVALNIGALSGESRSVSDPPLRCAEHAECERMDRRRDARLGGQPGHDVRAGGPLASLGDAGRNISGLCRATSSSRSTTSSNHG